MAVVSIKQFIKSGVHLGHQTSRWDPKMKRYIYGSKGGIHIIDLNQTFSQLKKAYEYVRSISSQGKSVLFVGTKTQVSELINECADESQSYCITDRWLGGMLTNFSTIRQSVEKLKYYEDLAGPDNSYDGILKKEAVVLERKRQRLERSLGGVKLMESLPSVLFVIDCKKEHLAIKEAQKLNIPIIAIVDTNVDPSGIDFPIPGNDDAARSVKLITDVIKVAIIEGKTAWAERIQIEKAKAEADRSEQKNNQSKRSAKGKAKEETAAESAEEILASVEEIVVDLVSEEGVGETSV